jgi:hypothetical protein
MTPEELKRIIGAPRSATHERARPSSDDCDWHSPGRRDRTPCKPLTERIAQLEKQIEKIERRKYVGVWSTGKLFEQGQFCTHDNSMWHCNVDGTEQRPGTGPDWTLAIKRGRDGKDGADASRRPTVQRSGGPVMS